MVVMVVTGRRISVHFETKLSTIEQEVLGGREFTVMGGRSTVWMGTGRVMGIQASVE